MNYLCNAQCQSFEYYWKLPPTRVYVQDLTHMAPTLVQQAKAKGIKVYGIQGSASGDYIRCCTTGNIPITLYIQFSTGTILYDYSRWDTEKRNVTEAEMYQVVEEVEKWFDYSNDKRTTTQAISRKLSPFLKAQTQCCKIELDNYMFLVDSFRGGAN